MRVGWSGTHCDESCKMERLEFSTLEHSSQMLYHIAGNFCKINLSQIGGKREQTFADCSLVPPKDATPPNFMKNTFADSHKTLKFVKVPQKFPAIWQSNFNQAF